jgi:hypothetical protein
MRSIIAFVTLPLLIESILRSISLFVPLKTLWEKNRNYMYNDYSIMNLQGSKSNLCLDSSLEKPQWGKHEIKHNSNMNNDYSIMNPWDSRNNQCLDIISRKTLVEKTWDKAYACINHCLVKNFVWENLMVKTHKRKECNVKRFNKVHHSKSLPLKLASLLAISFQFP